MPLPATIDPEDFDTRLRSTPSAWRAAVEELCALHGIAAEAVHAFADGSNLVAAVRGRYVVKIFPPFHRHQWESERRTLPRLHGQLGIDVPELVAQGIRDDGWPYLVLELLPGVMLETCWPALSHVEKTRMLAQIGRTMARVHALVVGELHSLAPDWNGFIRAQAAACEARHARFGAPEWLLAGIEPLIGNGAAFETALDARVILTGEYTPFNLLAQRSSSGWRLTGMIDLGDAMVGARAYDLLGPSLFLGEGNGQLIASLLSGYYGAQRRLDEDERLRLLALALLHRYANFDKQIRFIDWRARARSVEELARLIWPDVA